MTKYQIEDRVIDGAKFEEESVAEQYTAAEFLALVDAVLGVEGVKALRWRQYTPYFNDGDPCVFRVSEASVKLSKDVFGKTKKHSDYEDGFIDSYALYRYVDGFNWSQSPQRADFATKDEFDAARFEFVNNNRIFELNGVDTTSVFYTLAAFEKASENIETVAKANFGDHTTVTATKDGFSVEGYDHD